MTTKFKPKMSFEAFKIFAKDQIKSYLPDTWNNAKIIEKKYQDRKSDTDNFTEYTGLFLLDESSGLFGVFPLESAYADYVNNIELETIMRGISFSMQKQTSLLKDTYDMLGSSIYDLDYKNVKRRLFIIVNSAQYEEPLLDKVPHRKVCDLILTCHVLIDEEKLEGYAVTNDILELLGVSEDQLIDDAIENTALLWPSSIETNDGSVIITNSAYRYGASVLFYPRFLDDLASAFEDDFYIFPHSVDEVIAMPCSMIHLSPKTLKDGWRDALDGILPLTDSLYKYDTKAQKLIKVS